MKNIYLNINKGEMMFEFGLFNSLLLVAILICNIVCTVAICQIVDYIRLED